MVLRRFESADVADLVAYLNDPATAFARYVGASPTPLPFGRRRVEALIDEWSDEERAGTTLAVTTAANGELVGHVSAGWEWDAGTPDLAVVIAPRFRRRGLGTDTVDSMLRYLFDDTMAWMVQAWVGDWNEAGLAFAQANGFREAGKTRRTTRRGGVWVDTVAFDLLRSEYEAR